MKAFIVDFFANNLKAFIKTHVNHNETPNRWLHSNKKNNTSGNRLKLKCLFLYSIATAKINFFTNILPHFVNL